MKGRIKKPIALLVIMVMILSIGITALAEGDSYPSSDENEEVIVETVPASGEEEPQGEEPVEEESIVDEEGEDEEPIEEPAIEEDVDEDEEAAVEEDEGEFDLGDNPDGLDGPQEIQSPKLFKMPLMAPTRLFNLQNDNGNESGKLDLSKVAVYDAVYREWEITLTVKRDAIPQQPTSDVVLVIDRSGSMAGNRIASAKTAAENFVDELFAEGREGINIALVSYAGDVTVFDKNNDVFKNKNSDVTTSGTYSKLKNAINALNATGGTHTQAAIRQARQLLESSIADNKYIVLLSDGQPTYSYKINNITTNNNLNYFIQDVNNWFTKDDLDISVFGSGTAGGGSSLTTSIGSSGKPKQYYYYHHGNSAIAESKFAKDKGYQIFTIGLGTAGELVDVLKRIASNEDDYYNSQEDDLTEIFGQIASSIAYDAEVTDPMGEQFYIPGITAEDVSMIQVSQGIISYNVETSTITWSFWENVNDEDEATLTYKVKIKDDANGGTWPTNDDTTILYDGETESFDPIPIVKVGRIIYNANGGENPPDGEMFILDEETSVSATVKGAGGMTQEGYSFTGWNTAANGTGTAYNAGANITVLVGDITLYAQWEKDEPGTEKYNVTYINEEVEPVQSDIHSYSEGNTVTVIELPKTFTVPIGKQFAGWEYRCMEPTSVGENGNGNELKELKCGDVLQPGDEFEMPDYSVRLYAKWEPKEYTIKYVAGSNGSLVGGNRTDKIKYGDKYKTAPTPVANSGYSFNYWSPSLPGANDTVTGDVTFTAYFKSNSSGGSTSGGGSSPSKPKEEVVIVPEEEIPADLPLLNKRDHFQYIQGYPDGTVKPEGLISRDEVAAVFYRLLDPEYREKIKTTTHKFSDVAPERWSNKHIATLAKGGIITGYLDGTFKPGNYITRSELATIASRFDNLSPFTSDKFSDIKGHWANKYINSAAEKGWVKGYVDGTFKPDQYITRAEFVTLVNNVLERRVTRSEILPGSKKFPDLPEDKWFYEAMMEAVNSHYYERLDDGYENWLEIYYPVIEM